MAGGPSGHGAQTASVCDGERGAYEQSPAVARSGATDAGLPKPYAQNVVDVDVTAVVQTGRKGRSGCFCARDLAD